MFFFLRPAFKIPESRITLYLILFFFPRAYIILDDYDETANDSFWKD